MNGIGVPELLIILAIVVILFGANRLKGIGNALGGSIREFKQAVRDENAPTAEIKEAPRPETATTDKEVS